MYKRCKECGDIRHKENDFTSHGSPKCNECKSIPNPHRQTRKKLPHEVNMTFNMNGDDEIYC